MNDASEYRALSGGAARSCGRSRLGWHILGSLEGSAKISLRQELSRSIYKLAVELSEV